MKVNSQKFHLCLRFGDLEEHLTLAHWGKLGAVSLAAKLLATSEAMNDIGGNTALQFRIELGREGWFGRLNSIRALQIENDAWMPIWLAAVCQRLGAAGADGSAFIPHVTCNWPENYKVIVTSVAVMRGKTIVAEWGL